MILTCSIKFQHRYQNSHYSFRCWFSRFKCASYAVKRCFLLNMVEFMILSILTVEIKICILILWHMDEFHITNFGGTLHSSQSANLKWGLLESACCIVKPVVRKLLDLEICQAWYPSCVTTSVCSEKDSKWGKVLLRHLLCALPKFCVKFECCHPK